ncbi:MAG TPA: class I SAM-dependent RNA methyltransferase [Draconibacterium sp.]|nr:class I SAM-dependent RNA methyltransferase [Draconibacterium sp.]
MKNFRLVAKTSFGLENVLADEIKAIGGQNITLGNRAVFYEGDLKIIYKSNYFLRTALRVLKEIEFFHFKNVEQFYLKCKNFEWKHHFGVEQSFVIHSTVGNSKDFTNSMFASLKAKDAIADYFRNKIGKRPNVDTENPEIVIDLHIHGDTCVISLDSSGESLHKRGYRMNQGEAPLNEVLAAGMIQLAGWTGNSDFMDPMCGSGTLPVEAAMIAQNIPAGRFRKNYAFENWNDFDQLLFEDIKKSTVKKEFNHRIFASDISGSNLLNAQTNARRALVFNKIKFKVSDFKDLQSDFENGMIIINPPYGERLKDSDLTDLYAMMGERLKHQYAGSTAWILSSSVESFKHVGLKPEIRVDLYNGALKCKFNKYKMFTGKRNERT